MESSTVNTRNRAQCVNVLTRLSAQGKPTGGRYIQVLSFMSLNPTAKKSKVTISFSLCPETALSHQSLLIEASERWWDPIKVLDENSAEYKLTK